MAKKKKKYNRPITIVPYGGFANEEYIFGQARIIEDGNIQVKEEDGLLKNLWNSYKRLDSDKIAKAQIMANWGNGIEEYTSDDEGYVYFKIKHDLKIKNKKLAWHTLDLKLNSIDNDKIDPISAQTQILIPGSRARLGIISDIDDTVLHTGVSSILKWRLLVNSLTKKSTERKAFKGANDFYKLLHEGPDRQQSNPIFYLSNSPWNLHTYLSNFLNHNQFPKGPILLRDISFRSKGRKTIEAGNKYKMVLHIMQAYPKLKFVLIGDAAELDIDIYLKIADKFPERVQAVYIRAVKKRKLMARVEKIQKNLERQFVQIIKSSEEGIDHILHSDILNFVE
jgi:phosphatidate phosphatase APP1